MRDEREPSPDELRAEAIKNIADYRAELREIDSGKGDQGRRFAAALALAWWENELAGLDCGGDGQFLHHNGQTFYQEAGHA